MASTVKHLRSSTANKRPTASGLADGQLAINTASGTPGLFLKNSAGAVVKVGPAHVGTSAPNATPAGSAGNSTGELWVNNSTTINGLNYYTGSAFVNLTPSGTTTVAGLVELATDAETQTGTDTVRAVTPSGLQSKLSNSISTTSSTTIASSTAVKTAYDLANAALPKTGGRITGNLEIGPVGSLSFEGSSDDGFETTLAVVNPTAARTITLPNVTGTVITTGDSGTVTSAMIADGAIVNADINASAAIALSKLATGALPTAITVASANIVDGTIVNADINASAAIADTKLATIATAGKVSNSATTATNANTVSAIVARDASGNFAAGDITISDKIIHAGDTNTAIRFPTADTVTVETNGSERARIDSSGRLLVGTSTALSNTYVGATAIGPAFQVAGNSGSAAALSITRQTGAAANIILQRGVTGTPVADGQAVGQVNFNGFDGTNFRNAAHITAAIDGTPGANDMPGRLVFSTTADGASTPTERMRISSGGLVTLAASAGLSISSTGVTSPAAADGNVFSGTYTPTLTNTTNVSSSTAETCQYMRVGNVVTFSGRLQVTPTTASTTTVLQISLPIASNFANESNGAGSWQSSTSNHTQASLRANPTLNTATATFTPASNTNQFCFFHFTYRII